MGLYLIGATASDGTFHEHFKHVRIPFSIPSIDLSFFFLFIDVRLILSDEQVVPGMDCVGC